MRRTKEQAAETRKQILDAAEQLFLDKGFDNVNLEEIATAAGVTRGAVHWHYKNKLGLLRALRDRAKLSFQLLADELAEDNSGASLDRLGDLISEMFERLECDPRQKGLLRASIRLETCLLDGGSGDEEDFRNDMEASFERIFKLVADRSGLASPWTATSAAVALNVTLHGLLFEWALARSKVSLVPDGQAFIRMILANWQK